jgi:hypothetical protein
VSTQIKNASGLAGKTIERAAFYDFAEGLVLVFSDGAHVNLTVSRGYDNDVEIELADDLNDYQRVQVGLLSQEDYDRAQQEAARRDAQSIADRERHLYAQLHAKYGRTEPSAVGGGEN